MFIGEVVSNGTTTDGRTTYTFEVERQWKGEPRKRIELVETGWSCDYPFDVGGRYLVYAYGGVARGLSAGLCSSTKPAWRAAFDIGALPPTIHPYKSSFFRSAQPLNEISVERILDGLASRDERTRLRSLHALQSRPDALAIGESEVVRFLTAGTLDERQAALSAARGLTRPGRGTLAALVASLRHPADEIRHETLYVLDILGPSAKPAVAGLVELLADSSEQVRYDASRALIAVGVSKRVLPLVDALLERQDGTGRARVAESLEWLAAQLESERPVLARRLRERVTTPGRTRAGRQWREQPEEELISQLLWAHFLRGRISSPPAAVQRGA